MFSLTCRIIYNNTPKLRIIASGIHTNQNNHGEITNRKLSIVDFFRGKSVFLTGGTGFLGKVYIQKLLDLHEIDNIYILIRDKKGVKIQQRVNEIFNNELFLKIKQTRPHDLKKIVPIAGDVSLPNLGISEDDETTIREKVSVVIHSAATVRFFENLDVSMKINVEGTKQILGLCKRINKLEAFVHISTAYANSERRVVDEVVYPPIRTIEEVYNFIKKGYTDKELKKFIDCKPNTYTLTKSIAEKYIEDNYGDLPTAIVRPSIVTSTAKPPVAGWCDNWAGISRIGYDAAAGFARVLPGDGRNVMDMIPVDYTAHLTLAAAAKCPHTKKLTVYHSCSSGVNPATCGEFYEALKSETVKSGQNKVPFPASIYTGHSDLVLNTLTFVLQTAPAHIADFILKLRGKTPKYVKLNEKVIVYREAIRYFSTGQWFFICRNATDLQKELTPQDQEMFPVAPFDLEWKPYLEEYSRGLRKHLVY